MQASELAKKKNHLIGDEECINFRPSPNFKHMKKYLKSKFEESNSSPNHSSDHSPNSEEHEPVRPQRSSPSSSMAQREQPPLPPNSPPPEFLVVPKQEVEDEEYNDRPAAQPAQQKTDKVEVVEKQPEKTMCRQFARGMCVRGATCIYVHELILSQLPGVYTFCKNFQNSICNFPKCKFVHATVFEKEHFYRTGYLPPHTLIHLKESNSALGPPMALEGTPAESSQVISNPPPNMHPGVSTLPTSGSAPDGSCHFSGPLAALRHGSPAKRDWAELALAAHELDNGKPILKKCKSCDVKMLSIQCAQNKLEKLKEQAEITATQKLQLMPRIARVNKIFDVMLKSKNGGIGPVTANMLNNVLRNEKEPRELPPNDVSKMIQFHTRMSTLSPGQKSLFKQMLGVVNANNAEQQRIER